MRHRFIQRRGRGGVYAPAGSVRPNGPGEACWPGVCTERGSTTDNPCTPKRREAMASVVESIDVNVPVRTAYDQWTQFEEFSKFMEGVKSVQQLDDTHLHWKAEIGGHA